MRLRLRTSTASFENQANVCSPAPSSSHSFTSSSTSTSSTSSPSPSPPRQQRRSRKQSKPTPPADTSADILDKWNKSRITPVKRREYTNGGATASDDSSPSFRSPGAPRPMTLENIKIALFLLRACWTDIVRIVFQLHPVRMLLMILFNVIRGILPAYQSYSQASILDEVQRIVSSGGLGTWNFDARHLMLLVGKDILRMLLEKVFDSVVEQNATIVQNSVSLHFEFLQMQTRLRLDIPALADPLVHDLLEESNKFVNSFSKGSPTVLTPLGLVSLVTSVSEVISQIYVLYTLLYHCSSPSLLHSHLITIASVALPRFPRALSFFRVWFSSTADDEWPDEELSRRSDWVKARIAQMEKMAQTAQYRAEVVLFGLADWILECWISAKREDMDLDDMVNSRGVFTSSTSGKALASVRTALDECISEMCALLTNVPLVVQFTSGSLGAVNSTRSATERLTLSVRSIRISLRWSFDAIFDLAAFHAAMTMQPYLRAKPENRVPYNTSLSKDGKRGMKIEARNMGFTFPGQKSPVLKDFNLSIEPGEVVAVVGVNGSGKTTLLHILSRIIDFTSGELLINGIDSRRYDASDLHARTTAVFQSFCKFENTTVRENTGIGKVDEIASDEAVYAALKAAGAMGIVDSLDDGLETPLEADGGTLAGQRLRYQQHYHYRGAPHDDPPPSYYTDPDEDFGTNYGVPAVQPPSDKRTGTASLSGGQWQRIAIARALMRSQSCDLMIVDEANSALDIKGQREFFKRLVNRPDHGTIIYVTHRLESLHWADKVAVVEHGRITAFGTPSETAGAINGAFGLRDDV